MGLDFEFSLQYGTMISNLTRNLLKAIFALEGIYREHSKMNAQLAIDSLK